MTKQFKVYIDSNNLKSLWDDDGDGEPLLFLDRWDNIQGVDEVCDLLNEQHEQIERLKRNFKALDEVKCEIADENEQLKQELAIYRKVASCSNCKYHNYDWYDDGDEFEVCDKGNDVTDRICEDWEEL